MRAGGRRAGLATLGVALLVSACSLAGGGAAHATGVRTELGCTSGGFLAFWDAAPCPGDEETGHDDGPGTEEPGQTEPTDPPASEEPGAQEPGTEEPDANAPGAATPGSALEPPAGPVPDAPADPAGMVFTPNPAILTASTLSIEGLHSLEIVTVDLADGSTSRALKITADRVVIGGFGLDVPTGDGGLDTTATTLTVEGSASIWTPSITAVLADGVEHVIDTLSQPDPAALGQLLKLRLPLLGMTADSVAYTDTDQAVYEG
ncbi:hypothetical protein FLP10_14140 [Agromyces intestinalis]|uniref:Lipoprotein n=1 Tax=Agromyces intestinalis TaxID=2592652 RepID=A0A5C1YHJ2_9MICO|nr:hypothetical protein [Agromyces intestinalis]QEO15441.1 hypothetical protein FLP10_14140 [Agromyces intestinalis]